MANVYGLATNPAAHNAPTRREPLTAVARAKTYPAASTSARVIAAIWPGVPNSRTGMQRRKKNGSKCCCAKKSSAPSLDVTNRPKSKNE